MANLRLEHITSVEQLLAQAAAWDDLWQRSQVTLPTVRAELVAVWLEHFARGSRFLGVTVSDGRRLVAAMPLIGRRVKRIVRAGDLTWNYWSVNGELLLDEAADAEGALDLLAGALAAGPWPIAWFEMPPIDARRWQGLVAAMARRGAAGRWSALRGSAVDVHRRYEIGTVAVPADFDAYWAARSGNLRKQVRKGLKRLDESGGISLKRLDGLAPAEVEPALDQIWAIEDLGWKGEAASSVLHTPGAREFFLAQARVLARWGCLRISLLQHQGRVIAFALGWAAKGVLHVCKIGYDPDFAEASPGHVLWLELIKGLAEEGQCHAIDFQGPLTQATRSWATGAYSIGRIVAAAGGIRGRATMAGYRAVASVVRRGSARRRAVKAE